MRPTIREPGNAALLAVLLIAALGLVTNTLDIDRFSWDFRYYIDMARRGLADGGLYAPFAYRWAFTECARRIAGVAGSVQAAFAIMAYAGTFLELVLLYVLLRRRGASRPDALWTMTLTAFAYCNVRFVLFDIYRPETLALPLLILAMIALFEGHVFLCLAIALVGLQVREFLVIPPILLAVGLAWPRLGPAPTQRPRPQVALLIVLATALAIVLPRWLIPIAGSFQSLDVQHDVRAWRGVIGYLLLWRRDLNILYSLLCYGLPVLVLATPWRARAVLAGLVPDRTVLVAYVALTLILTVYGGTDVFRFVAYLVVPQAMVLARLLPLATRRERLYAVLATVVFNRAFIPIPQGDVGQFLDFYGGWSDRLNTATLVRTLEALAWIAGAWALRRGSPGTTNGPALASRPVVPPEGVA